MYEINAKWGNLIFFGGGKALYWREMLCSFWNLQFMVSLP